MAQKLQLYEPRTSTVDDRMQTDSGSMAVLSGNGTNRVSEFWFLNGKRLIKDMPVGKSEIWRKYSRI